MSSGTHILSSALRAGICLLLIAGCSKAPAKPPAPTQQKQELTEADEKVLQRFVDECLSITPGNDPYPKSFRMGSDQDGEKAVVPVDVVMPMSFRICQYETTQELYELVMGNNPSRWPGKRNAVETITFSESESFCKKLTALLRASKRISATEVVRLPTEPEWEYCCRAGTTTRFSFGDEATIASDKGDAASTLAEYAWFTGNAGGNDPPVGELRPNPWKLYDMHGYLWEYVTPDAKYSIAAPPRPDSPEQLPAAITDQENDVTSDGAAPPDNAAPLPDQNLTSVKGISPSSGRALDEEPRVIIRGGSWRDIHPFLHSSSRMTTRASRASPAIGFRCVIADVPQAAAR